MGWEGRRGAVEKRGKKAAMSVPSPPEEEGVEEMETEMSPDPNGKLRRYGRPARPCCKP